jgi:hypothetical protein
VSTNTIRDCGNGYDVVFIYGCLMHMPAEKQRALIDAARAVLVPGGRIVLMVYSWEFVQRVCGWTSPDEFDPALFARRSDPVVGAEACPWADWYDDGKLLSLAPGMYVARKQAWNDGQYVWYELSALPTRAPAPFFSTSALAAGRTIANLRLRDFVAADAQVSRLWRGLDVSTTGGGSSYAAYATAVDPSRQANAVSIAMELYDGACSAGLLDDERGVFVASAVAAARGRHQLLLLAPEWPTRCRIVFSNHRPGSNLQSRFAIRRVTLLHRPIAGPPSGRAH